MNYIYLMKSIVEIKYIFQKFMRLGGKSYAITKNRKIKN